MNSRLIIIQKYPWCEFAENAQTGAGVTFLKSVSRY